MLILSLDTSTAACSVALHHNNSLLGSYELFTERTSAAMLTTLLEQVVEHSGYSLKQIDAVAVAKGPGSYTGLRIGVSTAKGLCFALDKPLVAINTLTGMTEQVRPYYQPGYTLCPMIDARRMEVYCALYNISGEEIEPTSARIIDENSFAQWLAQGPVVFFGDGAAKCRTVLSYSPSAVFIDQPVVPSARTIGKLATAAFERSAFENMATFEPLYLKDFMTTKPKKVVF
ncbi:tRNA (adenosine(37)-N6)-threonylcarbamoyltransferase complex dimerization subunit type 1 TsaB [Spirosoma sp. SC4-14]|uniref:tRNA (adenosine(37)-N6)-threonylcarbamoyltransferase complex dimerization subunit type 1 TsaB n=1 Tax=Spirosoma sp. SC4-14 TaxID=3128900 RepID=UPI0030CCE498